MVNYKKKNLKLANVYFEEEIEKGSNKYTKLIATGISIILLGIVAMMLLIGLKIFKDGSTLPVAVLMYFITTGVGIIVYSGKMKSKYDIEKYNYHNTDEFKKQANKIGITCGIIMNIATIIYLIWGFTLKMWEINWIVYPVGGILCGIVSSVMRKEEINK